MDQARAMAALDPLVPGFQADGVALRVEAVGEDRITVRLELSDASCAECLLPRPALERLFSAAFAQGGLGTVAVEILGLPEEGAASPGVEP